MLNVSRLQVRYGGITAVRDLSIRVDEGETVLLVGANGAGKSSLINAVIGLVPASGGSISLKGADIHGLSCERRARHGIGYSPEGRHVFPLMSVRDNVLCGGFRLSGAQQRASYDWLASLFPMLAERAAQPAGQLSGGQQQIVAIARAMSSRPALLLLDEPFLGLAPVWIEQISRAVRQFQAQGATILMTEQMAVPALKLATRAYVMRGGIVTREGSPAEIREAALSNEYL
ncbi:ABC transporter ATP-binding protein [Caballeronia sp. LZ065]|uniref:ABC transporter ATP-binding protein n=1 Tax=Caballeronia sp. LZ065 TaxID=3038571 RepID=UPI0028552F46|nr:ABC transporter ATP-binding protein [Caballeronia sp. LZ065]MDR5784621.1 ABC transporter ATP-binding protein [Caballeronia sp. LZ065]